MATYSSILAWRTPWTEEPGGLWSMELPSQTRLSDFHFTMELKPYPFKINKQTHKSFRPGLDEGPAGHTTLASGCF